jgi:hypothetical protein
VLAPPPAVAGGGRASRITCKRGEIVLRGKSRSGRATLGGKRVIGCMKAPRIAAGEAARLRAFEPALKPPLPRLYSRQLPRTAKLLKRTNGAVHHRVADALQPAHAARKTETGPLPSKTVNGVVMTGTGTKVFPDDDEVGSGVGADVSGSSTANRVTTTIRLAQYEGSLQNTARRRAARSPATTKPASPATSARRQSGRAS